MKHASLLLSVKPKFSDAILDGSKVYELRRVRPRVETGDVALLYSTSPRSRVEGTFVVRDLIEATPHALWRKVRGQCGVGWGEFAEYFSEAITAFAIGIAEARRLESTVCHKVMTRGDLRPPQSFRYLNEAQSRFLVGNLA